MANNLQPQTAHSQQRQGKLYMLVIHRVGVVNGESYQIFSGEEHPISYTLDYGEDLRGDSVAKLTVSVGYYLVYEGTDHLHIIRHENDFEVGFITPLDIDEFMAAFTKEQGKMLPMLRIFGE